MKQLFTLLACLIVTATLWAQCPAKMSYQAVIRNSSNALVTNTPVGMKISILQGSASGTAVYSEIQTPTTNANGLISIEIGGTGFDAIDWSTGPFFIMAETDPAGGTNYTISGTSQLLSVPYALHSKTAESISGDITETDPVFVASPANSISTGNIANWNTAYGWGNHATEGYLKSFTETDPVWTAASANYYTKANLQTSGGSQLHFNNLINKPTSVAGYGILDAMTTAHAAFGISTANITNWNTAFGWGNHAGLYRTISYVPAWSEITSNPFVFTSVANNQLIKYNSTSGRWENWTANFLTSFTETDPLWTAASTNYYTKTNMQTSGASQLHFNNITNKPTTVAGYGILDAMTTAHAAYGITSTNIANWNSAYGWGNHAGLYRPISYVPAWSEITSNPFVFTSVANNQLVKYNSTSGRWENWTANFLTSFAETDPVFEASLARTITAFNITHWNTTFSWGNHALAGYLTSYTETDPKIGTNTAGYSPKWNGTTLVTGAIFQDATDNVGIGTTNPGGVLDVAGGFIRVQASDNVPTGNVNALEMGYFTTGGYAFLQGYNRGTGTFLPIEFSGSTVGFRANGNTAIKILTNGNVGIGTTNPGAKLEVNGQIKITGGASTQFLKADGSLDANTYMISVREAADEFSATASQSSFTLSQTPSSNSKVKMYINGVRISNTAYSFVGVSLTYNPTNNGSYVLTAGDRIQFDYSY